MLPGRRNRTRCFSSCSQGAQGWVNLCTTAQAGSCIAACPRSTGTPAPGDSTPGLLQEQGRSAEDQKRWNGSKPESQPASLQRAGCLPLLQYWGWLSPQSWAFPLLAATSQPASSRSPHGLPSLCQCWETPGFAAFCASAGCPVCQPGTGLLPQPAASRLCLGREGAHTLPSPEVGVRGSPLQPLPWGDISWVPWKRCRVGAATQGVSHAAGRARVACWHARHWLPLAPRELQ